ncbi:MULTISPECIES: hypothetical protein [unclassified Mesorhizobium]|nr:MULTISPECIES: hypothetical protein [unclassified Mesorhizobium]MBZ9695423.1 hypothetical protein [Mesorhizobium sp. CO1-1-9]
MDFIERIFGFSPDNGSGTFESSLVIAAMVLVAAVYFYRRQGSLKK